MKTFFPSDEKHDCLESIELAFNGSAKSSQTILRKIERLTNESSYAATANERIIVLKFLGKCSYLLTQPEWDRAMISPNGLLLKEHAVSLEDAYAFCLISFEKANEDSRNDNSEPFLSVNIVPAQCLLLGYLRYLTKHLPREQVESYPFYLKEALAKAELMTADKSAGRLIIAGEVSASRTIESHSNNYQKAESFKRTRGRPALNSEKSVWFESLLS